MLNRQIDIDTYIYINIQKYRYTDKKIDISLCEQIKDRYIYIYIHRQSGRQIDKT